MVVPLRYLVQLSCKKSPPSESNLRTALVCVGLRVRGIGSPIQGLSVSGGGFPGRCLWLLWFAPLGLIFMDSLKFRQGTGICGKRNVRAASRCLLQMKNFDAIRFPFADFALFAAIQLPVFPLQSRFRTLNLPGVLSGVALAKTEAIRAKGETKNAISFCGNLPAVLRTALQAGPQGFLGLRVSKETRELWETPEL